MTSGILFWIGCGLLGLIGGFMAGWLIWQLGFEVLGSMLAIIGAGFGGLFVVYLYMRKQEMI